MFAEQPFYLDGRLKGRVGRGRGGDALGEEGIAGIAQTGQRLALQHAAGRLDQLHTGGSRCEGTAGDPRAQSADLWNGEGNHTGFFARNSTPASKMVDTA